MTPTPCRCRYCVCKGAAIPGEKVCADCLIRHPEREACGAVRACSRPKGHRGQHGGFRPVEQR